MVHVKRIIFLFSAAILSLAGISGCTISDAIDFGGFMHSVSKRAERRTDWRRVAMEADGNLLECPYCKGTGLTWRNTPCRHCGGAGYVR
jgi:RecJ-like exonuclease